MTRILVTGGAGFIGRQVVRELNHQGHTVRVLDALIEQVHRGNGELNMPQDVAELVVADVRDEAKLREALKDVDVVVHLAAEVGVGQSMYAIDRYVSANDLGTAHLLQAIINSNVRRIVVASSMSIYGEGLYRTANGELKIEAARRYSSGMGWDPLDTQGVPLIPVPTTEEKRPSFTSVYALTKYVQEQLVLTFASAYGREAVALRLFNVFGEGQALSNPYTGVLSIFGSKLLTGGRPYLFEDGRQQRDFVHVKDVARAFSLSVTAPLTTNAVMNIGSSRPLTILSLATHLCQAVGRPDLAPEISNKFRVGDIRHCFADITLARKTIGYEPQHTFEDSLPQYVEWLKSQSAEDFTSVANRELEAAGLLH